MRSESPEKATFVLCVLLVLAARAVAAFKVASTADDEVYPSVSGNTVVWQYFNSRYGDWDIYAAVLDGPEVAFETEYAWGPEGAESEAVEEQVEFESEP